MEVLKSRQKYNLLIINLYLNPYLLTYKNQLGVGVLKSI